MFKFKPKKIAVLLSSIMLTACAGNGGSFDLDAVKANQPANQSTTPTYKDEGGTRRTVTEEEANALLQPALGYAAKIPRRNQQPFRSGGELEQPIGDITAISGSIDKFPYEEEVILHSSEDSITDSHNGIKLLPKRQFSYIRSGYVTADSPRSEIIRGKVMRTGTIGYVYYLGIEPSKAMPTQTATYKGYWDFTTNARRGKDNKYFVGGQAGINHGATPGNANDVNVDNKDKPMGHTGQFEVDFSNKTMTGTLVKNGYVSPGGSQDITPFYDVEAQIKGNRFVGKAKARNAKDPYFGVDSNALEGGFYGNAAQELAGKFLADDKSVFVVFAAKRDAQDGDAEQFMDSVKIRLSDLTKADMETFGRATHLVINGVQVPLIADGKNSFSEMEFNDQVTRTINGKTYKITVCCNNLDYVKFGSYKEESGADAHQYLVGERTPVANLPKGKAHYRGTWDGIIYSKSGPVGGDSPNNTASGTRSLFDVDFDSKKIEGKLIANNGFDERPMLELKGDIHGNGFTGTAKTGERGFNIDNSSTRGGTIVELDAKFSGGFYGPNAGELGGVVHSAEADKDKVSITFSGKRQVSQLEK